MLFGMLLGVERFLRVRVFLFAARKCFNACLGLSSCLSPLRGMGYIDQKKLK